MKQTSPIPNTKQRGQTLIEDMLLKLLARIDPHGYSAIAADLRTYYQPADSHEEALIQRLAAVKWRLQGCLPLETEILRQGMEAYSHECDATAAMARAFFADAKGPNLLGKLDSYQSKLSRSLSLHHQELSRLGNLRKSAKAAADAKLAKIRPCTSVIQ